MKKEKWITKLKPYWKEYREIESEFFKKVSELERKMNEKINPEIDLEFFSVDGNIVGIGAKDFEKRKKFPLIQDSELEQ